MTRKFPPCVGGLETAAFELYTQLNETHDVRLVKWGGNNKALPVVYPLLAFRALFIAWFGGIDVVYLQDGVLAPIAWLLKKVTRKPIVISVHGLDLHYKSGVYQFLLRYTLPSANAVVAGSSWSYDVLTAKFPRVPAYKIGYGVRDSFYDSRPKNELLAQLEHRVSTAHMRIIRDAGYLLLTTGRLVPRKGVLWFVQSVMSRMVRTHPSVVYIVVGDGADRSAIHEAVVKNDLEQHVLMLGSVDNATRNMLYNLADLFIMPNIPISGNGEGFGLVSAEAGSCGLATIAAKLEGIQDAVIDGKNGRLVTPKDAAGFERTILDALKADTLKNQKGPERTRLPKQAVRDYVLQTFSWEHAAEQYTELYNKVLRHGSTNT